MSTNSTDNASEFQIAEMVAELIDQLPQDKRKQIMAMLNTRYDTVPKKPASSTITKKNGYGFKRRS